METNYCSKIMEMAYNDDASLLCRIKIRLHTIFCTKCSKKIELYHSSRASMYNDFFPASPNMENSIMSRINYEELEEETNSTPGVLSTRRWVIAGVVLLISFAAAFLGLDFQYIANETGTSFVLPVGIIFGFVLTGYCAMFIGSHLKEFTKRFGL